VGEEPFKPVKTENVYKACCCPDKEDSGTSADQKPREFHNKLHSVCWKHDFLKLGHYQFPC